MTAWKYLRLLDPSEEMYYRLGENVEVWDWDMLAWVQSYVGSALDSEAEDDVPLVSVADQTEAIQRFWGGALWEWVEESQLSPRMLVSPRENAPLIVEFVSGQLKRKSTEE